MHTFPEETSVGVGGGYCCCRLLLDDGSVNVLERLAHTSGVVGPAFKQDGEALEHCCEDIEGL